MAERDPLSASTAGARLTVDPAAVVRNWQHLAAMTGGRCGAVVKANAYGHGAETVCPALAKAGCDTFFVALEAEGVDLRAAVPGATIYVLNGIFGTPDSARRHQLRPFISSLDALAEWPDDLPFALNIDTGMNRLGVSVSQALARAATAPAPALIASHFACADTPDHTLNDAQSAAFATVRRAFPAVPASLSNSAALLTRSDAHYDLARPGIALYGGAPVDGIAPLEPTVRLEARIIQVRTAEAGETVGYGAAQTLKQRAEIAIVSLGYADGFLRAAGGSDVAAGAPAAFGGAPTRLIGRVSMDLIAVDVTGLGARRGDFIELLGPDVPLETVARHAGTIGYELLTGLSRRAERVHGPL
ncbi:alanine racemase [Acuticoccus sp. MNP-M23]|uniref:alanine racemase n=1 Tax=Acuticoccus sp. MNP-M23 TaxID=3072793 RepID=UPI0028167624|nr:alanine racemase [Acuticoccus sp. MNP-M23]WMS41265.1 alanine racemase [Acuticoccus sp. MNP-M23]